MPGYLEVCEKAARAGGAVLLTHFGKAKGREKGPADLVTEADFASQRTIEEIVLEIFPSHEFLGEESVAPADDEQTPARGFRWIADPLDGTTNFVHGVPFFAVSLALEYQSELLASTVFNPCSGECFTAERGGGAFLNGERIRTSEVRTLKESLAAMGFPTVVSQTSPDLLMFLRAILRCQAVRRTGSTALNLSYLAAGRFDVTWSFSAKLWDIAGGVLLIEEAGGRVTTPTGKPLRLPNRQLLACAQSELHAELLDVTREAI